MPIFDNPSLGCKFLHEIDNFKEFSEILLHFKFDCSRFIPTAFNFTPLKFIANISKNTLLFYSFEHEFKSRQILVRNIFKTAPLL